MLDGTTYVVHRYHVRGPAINGMRQFSNWLVPGYRQEPDNDKSDFFVNPTGALGLLASRKPHPAKPGSEFPRP